MTRLLAEIRRRDRLLWFVGWFHAGLAALMLVGLAADERLILGINPWVKPLKFAVSITIYVWTVAWLLGEVRAAAPRAARLISGGSAVAMIVEIACIAGQSLRGVSSHFNHATSFDGAIFNVMGAMILLNTLLAAVLLVLYFRCATGLARPQLWGVRLGLLIFLFGSGVGGAMVGHGAHAIGAPDGGPGLPFVNWSTEAGDLRVAHALGLHSLQILPLLAWALARLRLSESRQLTLVISSATLYVVVFGLLLAQAMAGRPVVDL